MDYTITLEPTDKIRPALISMNEIREAVRPYVYNATQNKFRFKFQEVEFEVLIIDKQKSSMGTNRMKIKLFNNGGSNTGNII